MEKIEFTYKKPLPDTAMIASLLTNKWQDSFKIWDLTYKSGKQIEFPKFWRILWELKASGYAICVKTNNSIMCWKLNNKA